MADEIQWDYSGEIPQKVGGFNPPPPTQQNFTTPGGATITQQDIQDVGYKAATSIMGAPVDLASMLLRPFGYSNEAPIMGSEWMNREAQKAGLISTPEIGLTDIAASLAIPDPFDVVNFTKYATDVVPAMFVGAQKVDGEYLPGTFSDIASKKTMSEISDAGAETPRFKRTVNDVFYDLELEESINRGSPAGDIYKEELQKISKLKNIPQDQILQEYDKIRSQINTIIKTSDLNDPKTYEKLEKFVDQREPYSALVGHMEKRTSGKLKDFLKHDELYKLYPELEYLSVRINPNIDVNGYYTKGNDWQGEQIVLKDQNNLSTLLHEVQHKIQKEENFPIGGNVQEFEKLAEDAPNILDRHSFYRDMKRVKEESPGADLSAIHNAVIKEYQDMDMLDLIPSRENRDWVMDNFYDTEAFDKLDKEFKMLRGASVNPDAKEFYTRLWGEQQARATQYRQNMTPEERQAETWTQTLERKEVDGYREPLLRNQEGGQVVTPQMSEGEPKSFLERSRLKTEQQIASGEIPESGRTVISPYDNNKEYYLGDSGKIYFKRANGTWRESLNEETKKDINYVAKHGKNAFQRMKNEEDTRLDKAWAESERLAKEKENTYKMDHRAPTIESGASADNLTDFFPSDIYSKDAARLYGHGNKAMDEESLSVIQKVKGNPEADITIYRAVPKDIDVINPGDWVTTSKIYAKGHGESALDGNYKILEKKVKAKDVYTDGNDIHEWGYNPSKSQLNQYNEGGTPPKIVQDVVQEIDKTIRDANFQKWFKGSKIVNPDSGEPLVMYHGTRENFDTFEPDRNIEGIWFSNDPAVASSYAMYGGKNRAYRNRTNPSVMPVYIDMKNPKIITDFEARKAKVYDPQKLLETLVSNAKSEGYDGVIFKDIDDNLFPDLWGEHLSDNIVVFKPTQIKSLYNKGAFSKEDANTLKSLTIGAGAVGYGAYEAQNENNDTFTFNDGVEDITIPLNGKSPIEAIDEYYNNME